MAEFDLFQRIYQSGALQGTAEHALPDMLIVAIDANCNKLQDAQRAVTDRISGEFRTRTIVATPDPHIERWYIADPENFAAVVGVQPQLEKRKCERDRYKRILAEAVAKAGHVSTLGGIEFAAELVEAMDLYRAGKAEPSLGAVVQNLSGRLKQL